MKKLFIFIISILCLTSCIINEKNKNNFDNMIHGTWLINNEYRSITFEKDSFKINHILGINLHNGTYMLNPMSEQSFIWAWENEDDNWSIHWQDSYNDKSGDMYYIDRINSKICETIIVKGMPYSRTGIDTLYRAEINVDFNAKK